MIAATGPRLVPDVSQQKIDIVYSFTGAELLLFGAILYPGGRVPSAPPDVVVVVKGPSQALLVREKGQVAGIWINRDSARYRSVPSFYAVAATRPIRDLVSARTAATYEIGVDNLLLSPASVGTATKQARFQSGLLDLKERSGLFAEHPGAVSIRDGVLYRAKRADPGTCADRRLHRRNLPDPRRPGDRCGNPHHRHRQVRLRTVCRGRGGALAAAVRPGRGGAFAPARLGSGAGLPAAIET